MVIRHCTCLYALFAKRLLALTERKNSNQCQYLRWQKSVQLNVPAPIKTQKGRHQVLKESSHESEPCTKTDKTDR